MSAKLLQNRKALMQVIRRITLEAGEIALDYYDEGGFNAAEIKGDGSPVTAADRETEAFIQSALLKLLPDIPVIGEEAASEDSVRVDLSEAEYAWFVDPIDGTKQFVAGQPDFTVNIGLSHHGAPILGVIYAPAHGELYMGYTDENGESESFRWLEETDTEKRIHVRQPPREGLHVIVSGTPKPGGKTAQFLENFKVAKITRRASSLKSCLVSAGRADLYPRYGNTCFWDTAAAQAILQAAGGYMCDSNGQPLRYNFNAPGYLNPDFIASSFEWWDDQS